jgi:hypothetical protein
MHINVEWCNKSTIIKYIFEYVIKGPRFSFKGFRTIKMVLYDEETDSKNEVKEYLDTCYICDNDSCLRVYGYEIPTILCRMLELSPYTAQSLLSHFKG